MKKRHVIPISGKDSLATYIVQTTRNPQQAYEVIYNDTGLELPETYEWLKKVEATLGININYVGEDLESIIYEQGILPAPRTRYCTRLAKIYPMERYLGNVDDITLYLGIRADEKRIGYQPKKNILPNYPLVELGLGLTEVYQIVDNVGLFPPTFFWQELHDKVIARIGEEPIKLLKRYEFDMLFSWRSRPNCYNCFFQRQYEFIGLHDHHHHLFEQACRLESEVGAEGFTMKKGVRLGDLPKKRETIINNRVKQVVNVIMAKTQLDMFGDADELSVVSCGLFCGK